MLNKKSIIILVLIINFMSVSSEVYSNRFSPMDHCKGVNVQNNVKNLVIHHTNILGGDTGIASWYGDYFHGRLTANGETYNMCAMTAASRSIKLGTCAIVENTDEESEFYRKKILVRVNDRGPYADTANRIIDLSALAAKELGITLGPVRVTNIKCPANLNI